MACPQANCDERLPYSWPSNRVFTITDFDTYSKIQITNSTDNLAELMVTGQTDFYLMVLFSRTGRTIFFANAPAPLCPNLHRYCASAIPPQFFTSYVAPPCPCVTAPSVIYFLCYARNYTTLLPSHLIQTPHLSDIQNIITSFNNYPYCCNDAPPIQQHPTKPKLLSVETSVPWSQTPAEGSERGVIWPPLLLLNNLQKVIALIRNTCRFLVQHL